LQGIDRAGEIVRVALRCQKCGSSGLALWEAGSTDEVAEYRKLLSLSDGFYQRPLIGDSGAPEIICDRCGTGQPV
jgi:hypothetical protein